MPTLAHPLVGARSCSSSDILCGFGAKLHSWMPGGVGDGVISTIKVLIVANFALLNAGVMVFAWRRLMAFFQDRLGPNRVGVQGSLQLVADGIKLMLKEVIVPTRPDPLFFLLAPAVVVVPFLMVY